MLMKQVACGSTRAALPVRSNTLSSASIMASRRVRIPDICSGREDDLLSSWVFVFLGFWVRLFHSIPPRRKP